jgi:hypothetical protein
VAEVTGRSRRIVRKSAPSGGDRLVVENRAAAANLAETQAFMDDSKRILIFSDAGGTGRSYHAELRRKPGCASTICSNPAGKRTPPSRASAARTGPTRRSRRCSGPSRRTSRRRSALSTIARRSTPWAP